MPGAVCFEAKKSARSVMETRTITYPPVNILCMSNDTVKGGMSTVWPMPWPTFRQSAKQLYDTGLFLPSERIEDTTPNRGPNRFLALAKPALRPLLQGRYRLPGGGETAVTFVVSACSGNRPIKPCPSIGPNAPAAKARRASSQSEYVQNFVVAAAINSRMPPHCSCRTARGRTTRLIYCGVGRGKTHLSTHRDLRPGTNDSHRLPDHGNHEKVSISFVTKNSRPPERYRPSTADDRHPVPACKGRTQDSFFHTSTRSMKRTTDRASSDRFPKHMPVSKTSAIAVRWVSSPICSLRGRTGLHCAEIRDEGVTLRKTPSVPTPMRTTSGAGGSWSIGLCPLTAKPSRSRGKNVLRDRSGQEKDRLEADIQEVFITGSIQYRRLKSGGGAKEDPGPSHTDRHVSVPGIADASYPRWQAFLRQGPYSHHYACRHITNAREADAD